VYGRISDAVDNHLFKAFGFALHGSSHHISLANKQTKKCCTMQKNVDILRGAFCQFLNGK
jgi:hypothetical protein